MSDDEKEYCVKGRSIENNGILMLKDITEEDIDKLESVENNGIILIPRKLIAKLSSKNIENNGMLVPYEEGMRIYFGKTKLNAATLEAFDEPAMILQSGMLIFDDDVTPELVKKKIKGISNYGKIIAPKKVYGAVMAKCTENTGVVSENGKHEDDD